MCEILLFIRIIHDPDVISSLRFFVGEDRLEIAAISYNFISWLNKNNCWVS